MRVVRCSMKYMLAMVSILVLSVVPSAQSTELHLHGGIWESQIAGVRIALRSDCLITLPRWLGSPSVFAEASVNRVWVQGDGGAPLHIIGLSPVLQWQVAGQQRPLYLEAGIGAALTDKTYIGERNLSTHYQFEDMIRVSWQYSERSAARLTFMLVHYSNAGISSPNMGINLAQLGWSKPF